MLNKGQIKFTKKAAEIAKTYFKKKKAEDFLVAIKRDEQKPAGYVGFYKQLLGEKQDPSSTYKVYTSDVSKSLKIFETSLIKEGRLSLIACLSKNCLLYITKSQESKYKGMKLSETDWPVGAVDEQNNNAMIKFIGKMRAAVNLSDILLEIKN